MPKITNENIENDNNCGTNTRKSRKSAPVRYAPFLTSLEKQKNKRTKEQTQKISPPLTRQRSLSKGRKETDTHEINVKDWEAPLTTSNRPPRVSTPVRQFGSPNRRRRSPSPVISTGDSEEDNDRSRSIISPNPRLLRDRVFHPRYDPTIEIRQVGERMIKYNSSDWAVESELNDELNEDFSKYSEKLNKRKSELGQSDVNIEADPAVLTRRQKDLDIGKMSEVYVEYIQMIPKPQRSRHHPRTPNKFHKISRRGWDGMVKKWRKHLHNWQDANFSLNYRSENVSVSGSDVSDLKDHNDSFLSSRRSSLVQPLNNSNKRFSFGQSATPLMSLPISRPRGLNSPIIDEEKQQKNQFSHRGSRRGSRPNRPSNVQSVSPVLTERPVVIPESMKMRDVQPEDEEDTLTEPAQKPTRSKTRSWATIAAHDEHDDDNAMSAFPEARVTRSHIYPPQKTGINSPRKSGKFSGPELDVLHSGLTNDIAKISSRTPTKRSANVLQENIKCSPIANTNNVEMMSPSKRIRRSSGRDKSYANVAATAQIKPVVARRLDLGT